MSDAVATAPKAAERGVEANVDLAILALGLVVILVVPHHVGADGEARLATIERLVTTGRLESARYSVVLPLLATPFYLAGRALGDPRAAVAMFNPVVFTAALLFLSRELGHHVASRARRATLLLLVFGSMFPNHLTVFYGEVLTALSITLGTFWLARGRSALGWGAIVLGAVNTPATVIGVAAIAGRTAWRTRRPVHLLAPLVVFVVSRLESLAMRGDLFRTGYESDVGAKTALPFSGLPGFSYPLLLGVLAIFLSFGKGLVFFTPGLFTPVARSAPERLRWIQQTLVLFVLGLVVVYARWWAWYGGSFWGPRFFLAASVPAAIALATHLDERRERTLLANALLVVAVLLSFWVGVNGLVFDQTGLGLCSENDYALESLCHFVPEMSVLFHPLVSFSTSVPEKSQVLAIVVCVLWMAAGLWTARSLIVDLGRALRSLRSSLRPAHGRDDP